MSMPSSPTTFLPHFRAERFAGNFLLTLAAWVAFPLILAPSAFAQLRGPKVKNETVLASNLNRPKAIYVSDFAINPADFAASGPAERLNNSGIKARINSLRGEDTSPEGKAQSIVSQMGNGIVENLQNKGLSSTRVRSGAKLSSGWVVRGRFSAVDQGNRAMKTAVGFGAGATNVNVDVTLDEISNGKEKPILLFDTTNSNGNAPGGLAMAAATKNPYAIAIKFAMSGRDLQRNISKIAKLIADQIAKKAGA